MFFLQGHGGPGSIRVVKMGPGMTALIGGLVINPPLFQKLFLPFTIICNRDFIVRFIWMEQAAGSAGLVNSLRDSV